MYAIRSYYGSAVFPLTVLMKQENASVAANRVPGGLFLQKHINSSQYRQALRPAFDALGSPIRITSYNVCYTKLLRDASPETAGPDEPPLPEHYRAGSQVCGGTERGNSRNNFV